MAVLILLGGVAAHVRLLQGPIAVNFLRGPIESAINGEIQPLRIRITRVVMRYEDDGGLGLRLQGVRVLDESGAEVAEAPYAAVALSGQALFAGRVAPSRIDLIQPKLLAAYSDAGGLSLRSDGAFAAPVPDEPDNATASGATEETDAGDGAKPKSILLAEAVAEAIGDSPGGSSATSYLTAFGVRDAVIVLDMNGGRSLWGLPVFTLTLDRSDHSGTLSGAGSVLTASGIFDLAMRVRRAGDDQLEVLLTAEDLVPKDLTALFPAATGLPLPASPVGSQVRMLLRRDGTIDLLEGDLDLTTAATSTDRCATPLALESGAMHLRYIGESSTLEVLPSALSSTIGQAVVGGRIALADSGGAAPRWSYELNFSNVVLGSSDEGFAPYPISDLTARGVFEPDVGLVTLDRVEARSGDTRITVAGRMSAEAGATLEAVATDVPADFLKRAWPGCFGRDARQWVRGNIRRGLIEKATLKVDLSARDLAKLQAAPTTMPSGLRLDAVAADVAFDYLGDLPPIEVPRGQLTLADAHFEAIMPAGVTRLSEDREIALTDGRFVIADVMPAVVTGDIQFKTSGTLQAALAYLDRRPYELLDKSGYALQDLTGEHAGEFAMSLPLTETLTPAQVSMRGKVKITELGLANGDAGLPLQGGTIELDVTEKAITATGRLLVGGVTASLTGKRPIAAGQPHEPIRITATLDDSDRNQLGLAINHMVQGDVPVEILLPEGSAAPHLTADLTNAEFILDTMALRKAAGQPASVDFDIVTAKDGSLTLDKFKLIGNEIAIGGVVRLDANRNLYDFEFPDFSVNVITSLSVTGKVRDDGVLDVKAEGPTYDGRPFFRTLFNAGRVTDRDLPPPRATAGLDLTARFGTLVGFSDTNLRDVTLQLKRRKGKLTELDARGRLENKAPVAVQLQRSPEGVRYIVAESKDAGRAFKMIGLYNGIEGGESSLKVNIDGAGPAEKTGTLWARRFYLLGDPVVDQVLSKTPETTKGKIAKPKREQLAFDHLRVKFSVGQAQLVLHDSYINGPAIGATLRGNVDYGRQRVKLGGTYVPLFGLNSMFGAVPILGDLLVGRSGEGLLGITFGIQGPIDRPEVIVNPMSAVAPGIFRQIFEFNPEQPKITPAKQDKDGRKPAQSSSLPPATDDEPMPSIGEPMAVQTGQSSKKTTGKTKPAGNESVDGWQAETSQ